MPISSPNKTSLGGAEGVSPCAPQKQCRLGAIGGACAVPALPSPFSVTSTTMTLVAPHRRIRKSRQGITGISFYKCSAIRSGSGSISEGVSKVYSGIKVLDKYERGTTKELRFFSKPRIPSLAAGTCALPRRHCGHMNRNCFADKSQPLTDKSVGIVNTIKERCPAGRVCERR